MSTGECALSAKAVVAARSVSTGDSAASAKKSEAVIEAVRSVGKCDGEASAKSVDAVGSVSTGERPHPVLFLV